MNSSIYIASLIHSIVTVLGFMQHPLLGVVLSIFLCMNIVGVVLLLMNRPKLGNMLFLIGSMGFIPIGLIGAFGARKNMDRIKEEEFQLKLKKQ
ncbi:MAG TPA: hypothetical protein VF411_15460 [Bacteroidia bacterium]